MDRYLTGNRASGVHEVGLMDLSISPIFQDFPRAPCTHRGGARISSAGATAPAPCGTPDRAGVRQRRWHWRLAGVINYR